MVCLARPHLSVEEYERLLDGRLVVVRCRCGCDRAGVILLWPPWPDPEARRYKWEVDAGKLDQWIVQVSRLVEAGRPGWTMELVVALIRRVQRALHAAERMLAPKPPTP